MNTNERHWFSRAMEKLAFVLLLAMMWLVIADIIVKPFVSDAGHMQFWYLLGAQVVAVAGLLVFWLQLLIAGGKNPRPREEYAGIAIAVLIIIVHLYLYNVLQPPLPLLIPSVIAAAFVTSLSMFVVWES